MAVHAEREPGQHRQCNNVAWFHGRLPAPAIMPAEREVYHPARRRLIAPCGQPRGARYSRLMMR